MSATEWKFVPVEPTIEMVAALGFDGDVDMTIGHGAISAEIVSVYTNMLDAAPVQPSVESLLENWTPSDQQAFARFRDEHFPGEMSSYAIQSLGLAWKDGQANASTEVPQYTGTGSDTLDCILGVGGFASFGPLDAQPAAHLTIPGALEWDGDNGTHGADGESRIHCESAYDDAKEACAEIERAGAPGDVIREMNDELVDLRTELDDYKSKWLANCEALKLLGIHARHAEKLVKICREKLEVDSVGKGFIEALDGFIGALARDDNTHGESKAAPSGNYVQPVPEHCDRITWRGSYYHLPPAPVEEFPNCDYCGIIPDYHPWHGSGVINGTESPHIHACNECRHKLPAPISAYTAVDMTTAAAGGFRDGQAELCAVLNQAYMALIGYLPGHRNELTDSAIAACSAILFPVEAKAACSRCGDWGHIETEDSAYDCPECGPSVVERAVEAGVMNPPSKPKTCIECDQPYCHGVCVERGDQDYDRDQAAKGGDQ